jgi:hypothetical protein
MHMGRGTDKLLEEILAKVESMAQAQDEYLSIQQLAEYSKISVRSLRRHMKHNELPHFCVRGENGAAGKILVRRSAFDQWMDAKWLQDDRDIDAIVVRTLKGMR